MTFQKGETRPEKSGRKPGSVNKTTASVKEAFKAAFDDMGGAEALLKWGRENPTEFFKLISKLLPLELSNAAGEAFIVKVISEFQVDSDSDKQTMPVHIERR